MSNIRYIRISGIETESIVDGAGIRYVVFTQGCPHGCVGCHNPSTHAFDGGVRMDICEILSDIEKHGKYIDGITISGGEPFCQITPCLSIARYGRRVGLSVWCYTGYTFEELYKRSDARRLLRHMDILVDGPFLLSERSLELPFRGSRNQRIIDARRSMLCGKVVLKNF